MVDEHGVALDLARNVRAHPVRVRVHAHHLLGHRLFVIREQDGVAQRLGHLLLAVDARQDLRFAEQRLRLGENIAVEVVEAPGDLPGHLHVGQVVASHGHEVRARQQDVGRLQHRVAHEPERHHVQPGGLRHVLDGGEPFQARQRHEHLEIQVELGGLGYGRLDEHHAALRVDPEGQIVQDHLPDVSRQFGDVFLFRPGRQRVQVRDDEEALGFVLQTHTVLNAAHPMSKMQPAGRPVPCQYAFPCVVRHSLYAPVTSS